MSDYGNSIDDNEEIILAEVKSIEPFIKQITKTPIITELPLQERIANLKRKFHIYFNETINDDQNLSKTNVLTKLEAKVFEYEQNHPIQSEGKDDTLYFHE
jgi:hypothetical protein